MPSRFAALWQTLLGMRAKLRAVHAWREEPKRSQYALGPSAADSGKAVLKPALKGQEALLWATQDAAGWRKLRKAGAPARRRFAEHGGMRLGTRRAGNGAFAKLCERLKIGRPRLAAGAQDPAGIAGAGKSGGSLTKGKKVP
jgi:hypothetical protein